MRAPRHVAGILGLISVSTSFHRIAAAQSCEPGWTELGGETDGYVNALCSFADESGSALFAGGVFGRFGDTEAKGIARWTGDGWSPVGQGIWESTAIVSALHVHSV